MNQLSYNKKVNNNGLFSTGKIPSTKIYAQTAGFLNGLFSEASGKVISKEALNSSVNAFMGTLHDSLPEMQCFSVVKIQAGLVPPPDVETDVKLSVTNFSLDTWTSLSMPSQSIQFKSDAATLYRPAFSGISGATPMTIGYQDFVNDETALWASSAIWDFYSSQFTPQGYRMKGFVFEEGVPYSPTVTYKFYNNYKFGKKEFDVLWEVVFNGVVFLEPQVAGVSSSMGTLARSFSFLYESYDIIFPDTYGSFFTRGSLRPVFVGV